MAQFVDIRDVQQTSSIQDKQVLVNDSDGNAYRANVSDFATLLGGAAYAGVATPVMTPSVGKQKVFYLTTQEGTYTNFGNLAAESGKLTVLLYNGSTWEKQVLDLPASGGSTVNVVQATGTSTTDVMSQKAVTDELDKRQMAPATVGEVGQVLTQIGPNAEDVSWQTPSGGGGTSVTVVQETGDSTTDVMSQKAVTSELNDRVSKLRYTKDDLQSGIFYNTGGGVDRYVPTDPIVNSAYSAMKVRCYPGQVYEVYSAGSVSARAYAVADEWGFTSQVAESNESTIESPAILEISEYGWLYINCMNTALDGFKVVLTVDIHSILDMYAGIHENAIPQVPSYKNSPLPTLSDGAEIKILAIGNSYTIDGVEYLDEIASASTIDRTKFAVYQCVLPSGSLTEWVDLYETDGTTRADRKAGLALASVTSGTLKQILSQEWDIIVLQQVSGDAIDYSTFNPSLRKLVGYIRENCTNQKVCIAWQLVWAYNSSYGNPPYGIDRYDAICNVCKQMVMDNGIDVIIPTGTAIQNARNTSLNTEHELTRDNTHLSYGVGRYVAACTWFCRLLTPIFNVPILGNSAVHTVTEEEKSMSRYETSDVTADNNLLCQKCAFYANINMFDVTTIE